MAKTQNSLLSLVHVSKLNYGIHDDVMLAKVDVEDRKRQGQLEKKMIYVTFSVVDKESGRKKAETELSWFRLDHGSEYLFANIRELAVQLFGILSSFMTEEEAYEAMEGVFNDFDENEWTGPNVEVEAEDLEGHKWKKKEVETLIENFKSAFKKAIAPFTGDPEKLIRLKVTTDNKGEYVNIPKFGIFTESMDVENTNLKFTDFELRNHSKVGTMTNGAANIKTF